MTIAAPSVAIWVRITANIQAQGRVSLPSDRSSGLQAKKLQYYFTLEDLFATFGKS
jgi:hypothetical protein